MKSRSLPAALVGAVLAISTVLPASAQERCKMIWKVPTANTTYITQQQVLDVGDIPDHQLRIFEQKRVFPKDKPNCEGLKRSEQWFRGVSDYVDGNGSFSGYTVLVLENGDKVFGRASGATETTINVNGSKTLLVATVVTYTGGTGRYQGITGIQRDSIVLDLQKSTSQAQSNAEYWLER
jgi:hypothetical protein